MNLSVSNVQVSDFRTYATLAGKILRVTLATDRGRLVSATDFKDLREPKEKRRAEKEVKISAERRNVSVMQRDVTEALREMTRREDPNYAA